jgi:hypothetical protein
MRNQSTDQEVRGDVTSLLYKCLNSTGNTPICQSIIQFRVETKQMQLLREHTPECLSGDFESRMMQFAKANHDTGRSIAMLQVGQ